MKRKEKYINIFPTLMGFLAGILLVLDVVEEREEKEFNKSKQPNFMKKFFILSYSDEQFNKFVIHNLQGGGFNTKLEAENEIAAIQQSDLNASVMKVEEYHFSSLTDLAALCE